MTSLSLLILKEELLDNVLVVELSEERDFADGGRGEAFVHSVDGDSFKCNSFLSFQINGSAHNTIGTFADGV